MRLYGVKTPRQVFCDATIKKLEWLPGAIRRQARWQSVADYVRFCQIRGSRLWDLHPGNCGVVRRGMEEVIVVIDVDDD